MNLKKLRQQLADLKAAGERIQQTADDEGREVTADEQKSLDEIFAAFDSTEADIARRERLQRMETALQASAGRTADPAEPGTGAGMDVPRGASISGGMPAGTTRGSHGFRDMADFARAVYSANPQMGQRIDPRLIQGAATTIGTEGTLADGGYAVPPDFRETIQIAIEGETAIIGMTDMYETARNAISVPFDASTPWQTSGGILVDYVAESVAYAQSKPVLTKPTLNLYKIGGIVPITEELLDDAPALNTYLNTKAPQKLAAKLQLETIQGAGSGSDNIEGFLSATSEITVAKETGQAADTIVFANVLNMYSRLYQPQGARPHWFANQDTLPQLVQMEFPGDASPVFLPGNSLAGGPHSTLMGIPITFVQGCETVGTLGDLILVDLNQYWSGKKVDTGNLGVEALTSMHLWFDQDVVAFKFRVRMGGQSWLPAAITSRATGSPTVSNIVTLASRA